MTAAFVSKARLILVSTSLKLVGNLTIDFHLILNCPKHFKDGCNKITCSRCGALQCYLCKAPVEDYRHFVGQGAPNPNNKCPLW